MKVTINAQKDTSITKSLGEIDFGNYAILAGTNNSGKTSIVKAIRDAADKEKYDIIFIPADRVTPDQELKVTAQKDPFYSAITELLKPIFSTTMMDGLKKGFASEKKKLVNNVNTILRESGVHDTEFDIELKDIEQSLVVKLAQAIAIDLYPTEIDRVQLEKLGTGAQRMILAALTQVYAQSDKPGKETLFIFEEPETSLHPAWKERLHESLETLSKKGATVILTTHDPYFVELGLNKKVFEVRRNKKTGATEIEEKPESPLLDYKSDAEINYLIFGVASDTYFVELYEKLYGLFKDRGRVCDKCGEIILCKCGKAVSGPTSKEFGRWVLSQKVGVRPTTGKKEPKVSETRRNLTHGRRASVTDEEIFAGVKELIDLIEIKKTET